MFNAIRLTFHDIVIIANIAVLSIVLFLSWTREIDPILKLDAVYLHVTPEPVIFLIIFLYSALFLTMNVVGMTSGQ